MALCVAPTVEPPNSPLPPELAGVAIEDDPPLFAVGCRFWLEDAMVIECDGVVYDFYKAALRVKEILGEII